MINNQALGYGWYSNRAGGGTALVATHHNIEKKIVWLHLLHKIMLSDGDDTIYTPEKVASKKN